MTPFTLAAGILTFGWPYAKTSGDYVAIAVMYGICSGVYVAMLIAPIVRMGDAYDVGVRAGMYFTIVALGALAGPPISGAINVATGNFKMVGVYAGGWQQQQQLYDYSLFRANRGHTSAHVRINISRNGGGRGVPYDDGRALLDARREMDWKMLKHDCWS